ncbi:DUF6345 domain-containing protein [Umezawaea beigongshangensis]|uniref:DUF6345 domain-containing protein n=1 Tax=Umezawaea beigongshangensis TaxID=2780383 RepID=UPI0018F25743|nr:DUF6345 domain-containing protein [Umezawaea beigongshangensis]
MRQPITRGRTTWLALSGLITTTAFAGAGASTALAASAPELPYFHVASEGLDQNRAAALRAAFDLREVRRTGSGAVAFVDEENHLRVPSVRLGDGEADEDGGRTALTGIDFAALGRITALPEDQAAKRAVEGLRAAGALPGNARPTTGRTTFDVVDDQGRTRVSAPLDTAVSFTFDLGGIPLVGPGADLRVAFDPTGRVTQLSHSARTLERAGTVAVLDLAGGRERCAEALGKNVRVGTASYVYDAPALGEEVDRLEPSFRCDGIASDGSATQAITVPAAVDATLPVPAPPQPPRQEVRSAPDAQTRSTAPIAVGSEGTGPCSGLPWTAQNIASFNAEFSGRGVPVQFSWLDGNAWESDFKDSSLPGGHDDVYADDVDMTYWQGHGAPTGFSFAGCSDHDDSFLSNTDAHWGNTDDVEWMSLFTCSILQGTSGGQTWAQRWGRAFRGLHQINSFDTVSWHRADHGGIYGDYLMRAPFLWWNHPMKVRDAWAQASIDTQPASVRWATMGPVGPSGLANFDDYFHGRGTGPGVDTPSASGFYWRISGMS